LAESIQLIRDGLWTRHWRIYCLQIFYRQYYHHVKFPSPQSEIITVKFTFARHWIVYICKLIKCIIKRLLYSVLAWYRKLSRPRVCVIRLSLWLRQIPQTSVLIINDIIVSVMSDKNWEVSLICVSHLWALWKRCHKQVIALGPRKKIGKTFTCVFKFLQIVLVALQLGNSEKFESTRKINPKFYSGLIIKTVRAHFPRSNLYSCYIYIQYWFIYWPSGRIFELQSIIA